jgi:L-alanine-DL-glutamate epimerase-like enolase superfamily enzyme
MDVSLARVTLRLRVPLHTGYGELREREIVLLRIDDGRGHYGMGEAAPLEPYDGVRPADVEAALQGCRGLLAESDGTDHPSLLAACREVAVLPQALAALDLALWDLAGRRAGRPVWRLLGAGAGGSVEVNATIGAEDPAEAAAQAVSARDAGFRCIKVKVGTGDDALRLTAVRAAVGTEMAIRIDANGVWEVDEALVHLRALAPVGIDLCEEPARGAESIRAVRARSPVRVAIDESAAAPGALAAGVADAACLKIARCGGISGLIDDAARARAAGLEVYIASTYDGPAGIAAALHAAAAVAPDGPCGLATLGAYADVDDPFPVRAGRISVPDGPGLGLESR